MIERLEISMMQANLYSLLWMILGLSFSSVALQVGVPMAEIKPLLTLCFVVAGGLILWGLSYTALKHTSYVGETA